MESMMFIGLSLFAFGITIGPIVIGFWFVGATYYNRVVEREVEDLYGLGVFEYQTLPARVKELNQSRMHNPWGAAKFFAWLLLLSFVVFIIGVTGIN